MGNFSRNTFDPSKDYRSVRLQQGVPLVDADWNELADVLRQETTDAMSMVCTDGVVAESTDLAIVGGLVNDFVITAGGALLGGRPLAFGNPATEPFRYTTQPLADPALAARYGVPPLQPLSPPESGARTDTVYLDAWEREVDSAEDPSLINAAIGVETAVRSKIEIAVRVAEGMFTVSPSTHLHTPPPLVGHKHIPLATLSRSAGADLIESTSVTDFRPVRRIRGRETVTFVPSFLEVAAPFYPFAPFPSWRLQFRSGGLVAIKDDTKQPNGILPITLPDHAILHSFQAFGQTSSFLIITLYEVPRNGGASTAISRILIDPVPAGTVQPFSRSAPTGYGVGADRPPVVVLNRSNYYFVTAGANPAGTAEIFSVALQYSF